MKRILAALSVLGLLAVGGCNTAEGFGEDVGNTGDAIEKEADD